MEDDYKSYYLKDLLPLIDRAAMEAMMCPIFNQKASHCETQQEATIYNSMVAANNEGVRELASVLRRVLIGGESDD